MMADEARLLTGLKKRQSGYINQAIEIYTPYVSMVIYNMAGNSLPHEDVEEIVSDVFVSLWEKADYINLEKGTLRSYIAAIARNYTLKRLKVKATLPLDEDIKYDGEAFDAEKDALWKAVMELGEPDNEIFVRFYKYGERIKDISKLTGLNLSTVKSKLSRGKIKLKKILSSEVLV